MGRKGKKTNKQNSNLEGDVNEEANNSIDNSTENGQQSEEPNNKSEETPAPQKKEEPIVEQNTDSGVKKHRKNKSSMMETSLKKALERKATFSNLVPKSNADKLMLESIHR